jgi:hypothetical protein
MIKARQDGLLFMLLASLLLILVGCFGINTMGDFRVFFYSTRCLLQHHDPYQPSAVEQVYLAAAAERPQPDPMGTAETPKIALLICFPNALPFIAPFALLPWGLANVLWMMLVDASLILPAWMIWRTGSQTAPALCGGLAALLLLNSITLPILGNFAALEVGLCVAAVCCFLAERYSAAGVLCLAIALILKPQDAGFIWLYFLLAGGIRRRRALQSLALFALLSLPGLLWIAPVAPHWPQELHANLLAGSAHGMLNDPTPFTANQAATAMILSLQTVFSFFWNDARLYNLAAWLLCAPFLLAWAAMTLRARFTPRRAWFALAAISALSMLPTYHRSHDAKLLLLAIPACATLWIEGRRSRWLALTLTAASMILTGELPLTLMVRFTQYLHLDTARLGGKMLTIALSRPAPLILLATALFYLWAYLRQSGGLGESPAAELKGTGFSPYIKSSQNNGL